MKKATKTKKLANPLVAATAVSKATPAVKEGATQVNKDTKGALSWLIVIGAATLGYVIIKTLNNASKVGDTVGSAADVASAALDELKKLITDPNPNSSNTPVIPPKDIIPTISEFEAQKRATDLLSAMNFPGTNFEKIKAALSNINTADYALIAEKFGMPRYNEVLGIGSYFPAPKRNLNYWITSELDEKELKQVWNIISPFVPMPTKIPVKEILYPIGTKLYASIASDTTVVNIAKKDSNSKWVGTNVLYGNFEYGDLIGKVVANGVWTDTANNKKHNYYIVEDCNWLGYDCKTGVVLQNQVTNVEP